MDDEVFPQLCQTYVKIYSSIYHDYPIINSQNTDIRSWLLARLDTYSGDWPLEDSTHLCRKFVKQQKACFERDCYADGHITGSAWILCPKRENVLLTHHRKLDKWLQLGGHSDGDPNTLQVALREAEEESGIVVRVIEERVFDIDVHTIPAHGSEPAHKHYDVRFAFEADALDPLIVSDESNELRWVPLLDIAEFTKEESVLRMVRKTPQLSIA